MCISNQRKSDWSEFTKRHLEMVENFGSSLTFEKVPQSEQISLHCFVDRLFKQQNDNTSLGMLIYKTLMVNKRRTGL